MSATALTESAWLGDVESPATRRNLAGRPAKGHVGRQRKVHCERCGFIAYASRGALQRSGLPVCGCGEPMTLANLRDRAAVEWDALEAELVSYGRDAYDAAMRELGYTGMIEPRTAPRKSGAAQKRCQWEGGYCAKFASGRYCPEHREHRPDMAPAHRRAA
jgi:hypothetical protein